MQRHLLAGLLAFAACGDNLKAKEDAGGLPDVSAEFLMRLRALPNVHDVVEQVTATAGYHYFVLHFTQPVDHGDPQSATFLQEVSLMHRDETAPMIVHTSGYWDYYLDKLVEPTVLLDANQVSIEHRYFGDSRPDPADWSKLTIDQMAADEHAIVTALKQVYTGKYISTGGSKGGMTAIFYRRFFPDDVDGTVPYVAPISFAELDPRYPPFFDTVGPDDCRAAVVALATELLANRRAAMEARTTSQATLKHYAYTRIALGPAVEVAIDSLEWSFWQYFGVTNCANVPATTATDDELFAFLDAVSPPSDNDDAQIARFEAYYYQSYYQLGYPDGGAAYLTPYLIYHDSDYDGALPAPLPTYDNGASMHDIDDFVQGQGKRFLFVYGQWDPWTAGKFALGNATDSLLLIQPQGTHGSKISHLNYDDMNQALAKLAVWTGVTPSLPARQAMAELSPPKEPRIPSAIRRALRAHRRPQ